MLVMQFNAIVFHEMKSTTPYNFQSQDRIAFPVNSLYLPTKFKNKISHPRPTILRQLLAVPPIFLLEKSGMLSQHDLVFLFSIPNLISNYNELTPDTFDHCNHQLHTALHLTLLLQRKNASRKGRSISYINQILIEEKITFLYEIEHRKSTIETDANPFQLWACLDGVNPSSI